MVEIIEIRIQGVFYFTLPGRCRKIPGEGKGGGHSGMLIRVPESDFENSRISNITQSKEIVQCLHIS